MHGLSLACPKDHSALRTVSENALACELGHEFPRIDGVPVLLRDDVEQNFSVAHASMARARNDFAGVDERNRDLFLESLSITDEQKEIAVELARSGAGRVDPVVSVIIAATNGVLYKHLVGKLTEYPIPELRLPPGRGRTLLDVGCNWGRWSIAASRLGYRVVGIDPQLGAVMAARRVARQLGADCEFVVGDARHLPFRNGSLDAVHSYSVLQHLSRQDALRSFSEMRRVLRPSGTCLFQMAHAIGIRSLYHQLRRGFREARGFEVRYWTIGELRHAVRERIGEPEIAVDCYFGLGLQPSDRHLIPSHLKWIVEASERLRRASAAFPPLVHLADSLFVSIPKLGEPELPLAQEPEPSLDSRTQAR